MTFRLHGPLRALRIVVALSILTSSSARAITVTTTDDENGTNPAACSMREAIRAINDGASFGGCVFSAGDSEVLLPAGTYPVTLSMPLEFGIPVEVPMSIRGAGTAVTTIDLTTQFEEGWLGIVAAGTVEIESLTVANLDAPDAAPAIFYNSGADSAGLVLRDLVVRDNVGYNSAGLRILSSAGDDISVTLERVVFERNEAVGIGCTVGGAVGCHSSGGTVSLSIRDALFRGNSGEDDDCDMGGAIYSQGCSLRLENVTFDDNYIVGDDPFPPVLFGGGVLAVQTVAGVDTVVEMVNVTFFGNQADNNAAGGGALFTDFSSGSLAVSIENVTFAGNEAGFGGVDLYTDGPVSVTATNVLFGGGTGSDCLLVASPLASGGGNLDTDATCGLDGPGDRTVADPGLAPALADLGGLTPTLALLPGSPAIDGGTPSGYAPTDQRGELRPQDGDGNGSIVSDTGAFEVASGTLIFGDGFESGDTGAWTLTVP